MQKKKIIIIGTGCAGLAAGYTLRKKNVEFTIYESSGRPGGRCWNYEEGGFLFPEGAIFTQPKYGTTPQLCKELGITEQVYRSDFTRYSFWRNGKRYNISEGDAVSIGQKISELLRFRGFPLKFYPQFLRFLYHLKKDTRTVDLNTYNFDGIAKWSDTSVQEYVLKYGGQEVLDYLFYPILTTMVVGFPEEIGIIHIMVLMQGMSGMSLMEKGLGVINEELYKRVKDSVRLSTPVKKVVIENNQVKGVETPEGFVAADEVICCTDAYIARQIIPDLPETMRKPLELCHYSYAYYHQFGLEKKVVTDRTGLLVLPKGSSDLIHSCALMTQLSPRIKITPPGGELMNVLTGSKGWKILEPLSPEERTKRIIKDLQRFFPNFPDKPLVMRRFTLERAIALEGPGQFEAMEDLKRHHMNDVKGLQLAGEYTWLVACTEGAFITGIETAERILANLN